MNKENIIRKVCVMWTFLFITVMASYSAKKVESSFSAPDFAFPKQVAGDARAQLDKALGSQDGATALQALMQVVIADNLVSTNNGGGGAALIDSVASKLQQPYSSLAYLLEGRLYRDIYLSSPYLFNGRTIPSEPVPSDVSEWSRDIFSNRVCQLTGKAFESVSEAQKLSISALTGVVTNIEDAISSGLTVYDFMTTQGVANLQPFANGDVSIIPFFGAEGKGDRATERSASSIIKRIISDNSEWHGRLGLTRAGAVMAGYELNLASWNERKTMLEKLIGEYKESPFCGGFIINLGGYYQPSDSKGYGEVYKLAESYLKQYPECKESSSLKAMMKNMEGVWVSCTLPSQCLPGQEMKGSVSFRNISEFYILAVRVGDKMPDGNVAMSTVINSKVAASVKISAGDDLSGKPFYLSRDFVLPPVNSGVYALVVSKTPDKSGIIKDNYADSRVPVTLVSRLSLLRASDMTKSAGSNQALYVVEGKNQCPVKGANVTFTPAWKNSKWKSVSLVTDSDGKVMVPAGSYKVFVKSGADVISDNVYENGRSPEQRESVRGNLFTDLSIYHPGDTVRFSGVVYKGKGPKLEMAPGQDVKVILNDANYQPKDTVSLRADRFGRLDGSFRLPSDGLLGNWFLQMNDGKNYISQSYFEVADYKSPTFYVVTDGTEGEIALGDVVRVKGEVKTYSGMPVAGADVKFSVKYLPWRWGRVFDNGNATYGGKVESSADGSFIIELPTAGLKGTPYQTGRYQLTVTATDGAGETQESQPFIFSLGKAYHISPSIPEYIKIVKGDSVRASVAVYDMLDRPVVKNIYYRVKESTDSLVVASGEFESGKFPFDFAELKSGSYVAEFSLASSFDVENTAGDETADLATCSFVVWRESDRVPPVATPLWLPETTVIVIPELIKNGKVKVRVGSSYPDSYIFAEIADMNGVYDSQWIKVSEGIVEIAVKSPGADERVKITLSGMHDLQDRRESVTLIPEIQTKGLEIKVESFRDRLVPGAHEEWKFRFSFDNKDLASLPVMAVMSNKALNALSPFQWMFNPYGSIYWSVPGELSGQYRGNESWSYMPVRQENTGLKGFVWPEWNTYGYQLYGGGISLNGVNNIRIRGTRMMKSASQESVQTVEEVAFDSADMMAAPQAKTEMKMAYKENASMAAGAVEGAVTDMEAEAVIEEDGGANSDDILREMECPLAFFMPQLLTDNDGVASIDFDVPAFNGTWQLQVMGYTSDMRGAILTRDAIASKPVMVQMSAPRFARTGDLLNVSATIYNNSADEASLGGKIVIFNPVTGETYTSLDASVEKVKAMGSRVITAQFRVPSDIEMAGIKVYGSVATSSDGEQTIIPIYPSSMPVVEGTTFYLAPGEDKISLSIPSDRKDSSITLSYTDNPVWECVTALPALLSPDSENALAQASALYGNAMAAGLLKKYPKLMEALKLFSDPAYSADSTLVSALQKNTALKIVSLNNTPWVRNAQSETLRMESLVEYTDPSKSDKAIEATLKKLEALQNKDGGWSWCNGMQSSEWISTSVLRNFAMLHKTGFLPADALKMSRKGLGYVDSQIVKEWRRVGAKKYSYLSLLDYLYIRSFFNNVSTSSDFARIKSAALAEIEKSWKRMSIYDKATAASLLEREGRGHAASTILASLAEFISYSKEKGIWFDNLGSGFNGKGSLLTTAQVLKAWTEINPEAKIIDGLRQWLLLSKQTQDWGGGSVAADLVQAILDSGSNWTVPASAPEIYVNGVKTQPDRLAALTGSLTLSLTGNSGNIEIVRSASGPAWGGIVSQYVAPIAEVKSASVPQLSVEKNIYVISDHSDGTTATVGMLKKGDRVRVTLTIKADRDLQYVAVTDSRSAALEPAEQISGYTSSDGVWYYKEVRNSTTNLFIPFLSKGTHIISYDCFVDRNGEYSLGIAEAQSQYAPVITAHSAGEMILIEGDD
ncbi:MAG: hypothetical protein K2H96_01115 [Muribaculaceae bacterium]|nr:hypothetical protein [Muribaculaceae bacterium]